MTVDIETTLAPTEDGYPFTASRMALSGPAYETYSRILNQFNVDLLSASKGEKADFVGDDAVDPQKKAAAERRVAELLRGIGDDPQIQALLAEMEKTGTSVRQAFRQVERQIPSRPASQQSRSTAGTTPEAFQNLVEAVDTATPVSPVVPVARRRSDGGSNPFAGVGKLKVNAAQWDKKRLAPYLKNPDALLPLLTLWRLSVQLVYGTVRHAPAFEVGFLFDDELRAEYQSEPGLRLFSLNPVPVVKLVQALPNAPEVVAAYLHNKAAHEVTHALGRDAHDEGFSSTRETVADRTAQLLAPLTLITARLLGMRMPAAMTPAKPKAPRKKPEAKVRMRKSWGGTEAVIQERAGDEAKSPLYIFATEFARLFSEAGFPTQLDEEHGPEEDFKIRVYTDIVDSYNNATQITLVFYKDDFSGPGFYGTDWREVLTPAQLDGLREAAPTPIPLASQAVAFLQKRLSEAGYRKPGTGSPNRSPRSRRALVRQAEAILARS